MDPRGLLSTEVWQSTLRTHATIQHNEMNSFFSICSDTLLYVDEYVVCVPLNIVYIRQNNQLIHVSTLNISILLQGLTAHKQE